MDVCEGSQSLVWSLPTRQRPELAGQCHVSDLVPFVTHVATQIVTSQAQRWSQPHALRQMLE